MITTSQNIYSLNGQWHYVKDPGSTLSYEIVKEQISRENNLPEMRLPQNWQSAGLDNFSGTVWFIKYFDWGLPDMKMKALVFSGVDYFSDVWINDTYLGHHEGYFQKFHFNITDHLYKGRNLLIVKVTSPEETPGKQWPDKKKLIKGIFNHHDCRPGGWSLKDGQDKNTGGIWNDVYIEHGGELYIENVKVTSKLNPQKTQANILISVYYQSLKNSEENVLIEVLSPSGKIVTKEFQQKYISGRNEQSFLFVIDYPELWYSWDTGPQNLYRLKISSSFFNERNISFGIKEVILDNGKQFFLNGKRLFLRGTNIIPTHCVSDFTDEKIPHQISLMKEANINIIRVHAHVNRAEFYDECDRQGILVWQDFALQWTYDESGEFITNAVRQIKEMVREHYNHPAIAFWCCHNEPGEQIMTLDPFLNDAVLNEDNSRIVRMASNYEEHPYDGWYWGKKEHFAAAPMGPLVTEFGAQALPEKPSLGKITGTENLFPPDWENWKYHNFQYQQTFFVAGINMGSSIDEFIENSQQYQADLLKTAIDAYRRKKNSGITGIFQFMFIDCWPSISWSVVDYYGQKKKGYNVIRSAYQPLYLSVDLRQDTYLPEERLNLELWLINDLWKDFNSLSIIISIDDTSADGGNERGKKIISEIKPVSISGDSIRKYGWPSLNIKLPADLKQGRYKLYFEIKDELSGEIISFNEAEIIIHNPL